MSRIKKYCKNIQKNVSLSKLTTIKIGGKAKYVAFPNSESELVNLVSYLERKNKNYFVLGNGSNVLACDKKYKGVIIKLSTFNAMSVNKNIIHIGAGASLGMVTKFALDNKLSGLEFACGIPGSVGGAIKMNAGAYGSDMSRVVKGVYVLRAGKVIYIKNKNCGFAYRSSGFKDNDIIISVDFKLITQDKAEILKKQEEILEKRKCLPKYPSLGSIFKRKDGLIVSEMLDQMKLKGVTFGGAMVSHEHAGIIVNIGDATCEDVKQLINYIKKRCFLEKNVELEEEIKYLDNK